MFKRLMMGLLAASLLVAWVVPEAEAYDRRLRRTVENFHACNQFFPDSSTLDPCYGATEVTDKLYGYDGTNITCQMTGYLFCNPDVIEAGVCPVAENEPVGLTEISYTKTATFVDQTAENLTVLDEGPGQAACNLEYPPDGSTTFEKFWPSRFVAHTIYRFDGGSRDGDDPYELIEDCEINLLDPEYTCTKLWDSNSGGEPPRLPCCGEDNTLTVQVAPPGSGRVSDPDGTIIDCGTDATGTGTDCDETYNGTVAPYDGCPEEIVLTALPFEDPLGSSYTFSGWIGGVCDGSESTTCRTTAEGSPTITANFEASCHTLTVTIVNGDANDRVRLFRPSGLTYDHPDGEDICDINDEVPCWVQFCGDEIGTRVTVKKQGDDITWGGDCIGVPNSFQCTVEMDQSRNIIVDFD